MKQRLLSLPLIFATALLLGCSSAVFDKTGENVDETQAKMKHLHDLSEHATAPVLVKDGYYVDTNPVAFDKNPAWMSRPLSLHAKQMPLRLLTQRLLRDTKVTVSYSKTVNPNQLVSINYEGTIGGALKTVADEINYHYTTTKNSLRWSALATKTFNISFMPGSSNYLVGQQQGSNGSTSADSSSDNLSDQQYSNLHGTLSIWNDLEKTLNQLKSTDGKIIVSESTTSVTVHDHPRNIKAMARYIKRLNKTLSQEVEIKVRVLEVELNKNYNYGINWNVVANTLDTGFNLTGNLATANDLTQNNLILSSTTSSVGGLAIGGSSGSQTLINALNQQGKVRVVTQPQVITMNNQIASIRITQNTGYVESVSQTTTENYATTSITPGTVTDGFTLYVLPKIQRKKVFMQISSTIANLESLQKVSTEPTTTNSTSTSTEYEAIQVPTVSQKSFNQRSLVTSGSTLIIAGYKRLQDETTKASYFSVDQLGGKGAAQASIETLVLITPVILNTSTSNVDTDTE